MKSAQLQCSTVVRYVRTLSNSLQLNPDTYRFDTGNADTNESQQFRHRTF